MPELVVASFNVHGGVDGWGRPFDVVEACRRLDADVLLLAESWRPAEGPSVADQVAAALGYELHPFRMAPARLHPPDPSADRRWGPRRRAQPGRGLRAEVRTPRGRSGRALDRGARGSVELALASRLPVRAVDTVDLGRMPGDLSRRGAVLATVEVGTRPLLVAGTHMSHLRHGSVVQLRRLARELASRGDDGVLLGDLNLWGPPLLVLLPGWRRAVRGRTWPSWRPLAQIDHILVTRSLDAVAGSVVRAGNSDHLPVRAVVALP